MLGDKSYKVEIIQKDVESNSDTAASRAGELITDAGVDLMLAIATPEMINPVADQCEANGVPVPVDAGAVAAVLLRPRWRPGGRVRLDVPLLLGCRAVGRGVRRPVGRRSTPTRPSVCCAPTTPTATRLADPKTGFPAGAAAGGYKLVDPGRFQTLSDDFSSVIGQMKDGGVEIVVGIPIPPDFATFWTQAKQQGFNPKLVTMAKAVLFSSAVEALGDIGDGLASEVWWTPNHPFKQLADR